MEPSFTFFLPRLLQRAASFSRPCICQGMCCFSIPQTLLQSFLPRFISFQQRLLGFISIKSFGHWEVGLPHLAVAVSSVSESMCACDRGPVQGQWDVTNPLGVSLGAHREMGSSANSMPLSRRPGVTGFHLCDSIGLPSEHPGPVQGPPDHGRGLELDHLKILFQPRGGWR